MSVRIHYRATGLRDTRETLHRMKNRSGTAVTVLAPRFRRYMQSEVLVNFATESDSGDRWAPLAPLTILLKKGPQKLIETGRMYQSLVGDTPDTIFRVRLNSMEYGTSVPYALVHQIGEYNLKSFRGDFDDLSESDLFTMLTGIGGGPFQDSRRLIPARPYMPRPHRVANYAAKEIIDYVVADNGERLVRTS